MAAIALIGFLALSNMLTFVTPVFADMAAPDSPPSVSTMAVYRNLLTTGDRCFVWEANIPYASLPTLTEPYAFIWRLIDTDNVTELGATTGSAFANKGYGYNVYSMYFADNVSLAWNQTYYLRLSGNPAAFAGPPEYNFSVNVSDYTLLTASADNKVALAATILQLAADLDTRWGYTGTDSLLLQTETGTVLSIYGEAVFRGAIYGVQSLAPAAFRIIVQDMDALDRTWTTAYADNLTTQYAGTWIETSKSAGASLFGTSYDLASVILAVVLGGILFFGATYLLGKTALAFVLVAVWLVIAPKLDMYPLAVTALVCALFVIYEGTKVKGMIR